MTDPCQNRQDREGCEKDRQGRGDCPEAARGDHADLHQDSHEDDRRCDEDHNRGDAGTIRPDPAPASVGDRRRGAGDRSSEDACEHRPHLLTQELVTEIPDEADSDDQHHHQPDLAGIEHIQRPVGAIWENRKDDQGDDHEPHDGGHVGVAEASSESGESRLSVEKHGHRSTDGEPELRRAENQKGPEPKHEEDRDLGRDSRILIARAQLDHVPDDHHRCDGEKSRSHHPPPEHASEERRQSSEQGDQRERPDAGDRALGAFTLHADQQPEPQGDSQPQNDRAQRQLVQRRMSGLPGRRSWPPRCGLKRARGGGGAARTGSRTPPASPRALPASRGVRSHW